MQHLTQMVKLGIISNIYKSAMSSMACSNHNVFAVCLHLAPTENTFLTVNGVSVASLEKWATALSFCFELLLYSVKIAFCLVTLLMALMALTPLQVYSCGSLLLFPS